MILGVLEHLGVELPLSVVGLAAELELKVCSGHRPRRELVPLLGQSSWVPRSCWYQFLLVMGQADVSSSPLIL